MKKTLRTTFAAALFAALVSAPAAAATKYGKGVSEAASVKLSELMAKPDAYVGKVVKVEGLITGVCAKRNAATSAKVNLPRLRSRSASRKVTTGQPTRKPIE